MIRKSGNRFSDKIMPQQEMLTLRSSFSRKWRPRPARFDRDVAVDVVKSAFVSSECGVMRNIVITAAVIGGLGVFMAQIADKIAPATATVVKAKPAATVAMANSAPSGSRTLSIPRDFRGHFATEGRID